MNNGFLFKVTASAVIGLHPAVALADRVLTHPIKTIRDFDTKYDQVLSTKARKLLEYIITKEKVPEVVYGTYTSNKDVQEQTVELIIDDFHYSIHAHNANEGRDLGDNPIDSLSITVKNVKTTGVYPSIQIYDTGLDGHCNGGFLPSVLNRGVNVSFVWPKKEGDKRAAELEHEDQFQGFYERTLDRLIKFYEKR